MDEFTPIQAAQAESSYTIESMYQRLMFGDDAKAYVRLKLSVQSTLWRLLAKLPIEMGRVLAYLPPSAMREDLSFFEWHIHAREDLEALAVDREYIGKEREFLAQCLQESTRLGIFYGVTVPPGGISRTVDLEDVATFYYPFPITSTNDLAVAGPVETYYIVKGGIARERLDYVLNNVVERLPFFGAVSSLSAQMQLPESKTLDSQVLAELARRTLLVMVGSYGGDANLIWTRT